MENNDEVAIIQPHHLRRPQDFPAPNPNSTVGCLMMMNFMCISIAKAISRAEQEQGFLLRSVMISVLSHHPLQWQVRKKQLLEEVLITRECQLIYILSSFNFAQLHQSAPLQTDCLLQKDYNKLKIFCMCQARPLLKYPWFPGTFSQLHLVAILEFLFVSTAGVLGSLGASKNTSPKYKPHQLWHTFNILPEHSMQNRQHL